MSPCPASQPTDMLDGPCACMNMPIAFSGVNGSLHVQVTEAQLADLFKESGKVVDCRVCGDPNSAMRFAFIEFAEEAAVQRVRQQGLRHSTHAGSGQAGHGDEESAC